MKQSVYLDNSSTTKPCEKAVEYIVKSLNSNWGNPSSLHKMGMEAEIAVESARETVARSIGAENGEIFFTGSGTEANNTAILSVMSAAKRGGRIITTLIEHPSVLETVKRLENAGFEVVRLSPDKNGVIQVSELEKSLTKDTLLVSMMLVNNETGAVQNIKECVAATKKSVPTALFHCDAVQGYGKLPVKVKNLGVDLLSASGHKIHGPKGIGFLFIKNKVHINPLITGGGQEKGMRSGTEPVPLIMGLAGAVEALPNTEKQLKIQTELRDYAIEKLIGTGVVTVNSPADALPYILNISVPGYRSETLLHFLEANGIYVSSGSACAKGKGSYVLREMQLNELLIDSALRISFSRFNTENDIDLLCESLKTATGKLRKAF